MEEDRLEIEALRSSAWFALIGGYLKRARRYDTKANELQKILDDKIRLSSR